MQLECISSKESSTTTEFEFTNGVNFSIKIITNRMKEDLFTVGMSYNIETDIA